MKPSKQLMIGMLALLLVGAPCNVSNTFAYKAARETVSYRPAAGAGNIPMHFEENVGQTDQRVRFVGRGNEYSVLVTDSEAVFKLPAGGPNERGIDIRMQWVGANTRSHVVAEQPLPGKSNYLLGNDPAGWKTNIPTFGNVRSEEVYPGVDVEFYGKGALLEYDLVVKPGADPDVVRLRFSGAEDLSIDGVSGDLVLKVNGGELRHKRAVVYQPTSAWKKPIEARYSLTSSGEVGFDLGEHDSSQPLVIDPVVTYVQFVGGSGSVDNVTGTASDAAGNVYVTGETKSINFSPLVSPFDSSYGGDFDVFVMKLDPATGSVLYSTYIGTPSSDNATAIAVDAQGFAYVTGRVSSPSFPTTVGAYRQTIAGDIDGFVSKLAANGASLVYSTFLGGGLSDAPYGIAVDTSGQTFVVGQTTSGDLETLPGAYDRALNGSSDAFVLKLNSAGSSLVQATFLGGGGPDEAFAVDVTNSGDVIVAGRTQSLDFPRTAGAFDQTFDGFVNEGFVTRLSATLSATPYSSLFGRFGDDAVFALAVDPFDRAVIAGGSNSVDLPVTPGAPQPIFGGGVSPDGFLARVSASGASLEYCTYFGGAALDQCLAVETDSTGAIFVTGNTLSANFPTTAGAFDGALNGSGDVFVAKCLETGVLGYSTLLGGDAFEGAGGLALTSNGKVAVAGVTYSSNFPVTASLVGRPPDGIDCFLAELSADGAAVSYASIFGGDTGFGLDTLDTATSILASPDGSVILAGATTSVNFPTTPGGFDSDRGDDSNAFVFRVDADGRSMISSTVFGGIGPDKAFDVGFASDGDLMVVGSTASPDFPVTSGSIDSTFGGSSADDAFVVRIDAGGSQVQFGTYLGGAGDDEAHGVDVDAADNVFVVGTTASSDFPITPGAFDSVNAPLNTEAFVARTNATGTALTYSTYLGGTSTENGVAIAVDSSGEAAVTGQTASTNFPVTSGAYRTVNQGGQDVFVSKLNPTGTGAVFSTYLGGTGSEQPGGIVIDASGDIVISGATNSSLFPTTPGGYDTTFNGGFVDGFVSALQSTGAQLAFSSFFGGSGDDILFGLASDSVGNLWACGSSDSSNLPFPPNAYDTTNAGQQDALLVSFDSSCSQLRYASYVGGNMYDAFLDVSVGPRDAIAVAGRTDSVGLVSQGFGVADANSALFARFVRSADTVGLYVPSSGAWFPRFVNAAGPANLVFSYGAGGSGLVPLAGNWDGVGGDSPGLYDPSTGAFFLRNSNSPGPADLVFTFGPGGSDFVPLAGDWNGDGTDTIGIYSLSTGAFFLRNVNAGGPADLVFSFGPGGAGFTPVAGDWNGDGTETIGIYQIATGAFFLRNANAGGGADLVFTFGSGGAGVVPVTGDWNGDGADTIGIVLQSSGFFFLRDSNTAGPAEYAFGYGAGGETPVVGNWAG